MAHENSQKVTIEEAATALGISKQAVREWCKLGYIPCVVIDKKKTGKACNQYFIPRERFNKEFLGITE